MLTAHPQTHAKNDGKISYYPAVVGESIPETAKKSLIARMEQALTQNGAGSVDYADRFVMLAKCNILEKDVAPTTPPRVTQTIEVTFILGDVVENKTYASAAVELKGIGINETKSWQTAFNSFKPGSAQIKEMFALALTKIDAYYSANSDKIIAEAQTLAATGEYDRAIASLMSVPDINAACHTEALNEAAKIYKQKVDAEGAALLSRAKNLWAASPDYEGADKALACINSISPASASFTAAETLVNEISAKLSSDSEREWQQRIKEYNDEKEFRHREQSNAHARSMATIASCRSVAEKWAENQPQTKVYLNW